MQASKPTLKELQSLIKKMTICTIQKIVLPELGMDWKKVSHTVAVTNQPLNSDSVARIICKIAAITIPRAKIEDILGRLKFIVIANQTRTWHAVRLLPITDPSENPLLITALNLPHRIGNCITCMTEVEALLIENLLHWRVRTPLNNEYLGDSFLEGCIIPGEPVALFSSISDYSLVQGCVEALGYGKYEDLKLQGQNISYLLCKACEEKPPEPPSLPPPEISLSDTDENPVLKPKLQRVMLSMIQEESVEESDIKEEPISSMWPGPSGDRYIERRCESCQTERFDKTLMETTINLTIDSD